MSGHGALRVMALAGAVRISYISVGIIHNWSRPNHGIALVWSNQGEGWTDSTLRGFRKRFAGRF
jgi:hypothetical protein